jgi:hypothetical protein
MSYTEFMGDENSQGWLKHPPAAQHNAVTSPGRHKSWSPQVLVVASLGGATCARSRIFHANAAKAARFQRYV